MEIAVGGSHACVLQDPGGVRCWGAGGAGQLGLVNGTSNVGDEPNQMPPLHVALPMADVPGKPPATPIWFRVYLYICWVFRVYLLGGGYLGFICWGFRVYLFI